MFVSVYDYKGWGEKENVNPPIPHKLWTRKDALDYMISNSPPPRKDLTYKEIVDNLLKKIKIKI